MPGCSPYLPSLRSLQAWNLSLGIHVSAVDWKPAIHFLAFFKDFLRKNIGPAIVNFCCTLISSLVFPGAAWPWKIVLLGPKVEDRVSFIHSFNKYFWGTNYMRGIKPGMYQASVKMVTI